MGEVFVRCRRPLGFTLIELVAVLVLIAIVAGVASARFSNPGFDLQSSRAQVVSAFLLAQQLAMAEQRPVRLITQTHQIDIRQDEDADGTFAVSESVFADGQQYPQALNASHSLTASTFNFDRRGRTPAQTLILSQGSVSVNITVTAAGHIQ